MEITTKTADLLVVQHQPTNWIIGLGAVCVVLLIGLARALVELSLSGITISLLMLTALGWLMLTQVVRRLQLIADRHTDLLQIKATTPLGEKVAEYPLSALQRSETQTRHGSQSIPETMLVLVFGATNPASHVKFNAFRPDVAAILSVSEQLNQWLEEGRRRADGAITPDVSHTAPRS
ncbi:hypothetical protein [Haliea sp.]|uniref:hypothetical protein n=1 Tax=Haliea sp. TaxID=1932666 RepID=UPI0035283E30